MKFSEEFLKAVGYHMSGHAEQRLQQRGFRAADVDLVLAHGTECAEATILMPKDADEAIARRKREIEDLRRLKGTAVIHQEGVVATVYRPSKGRTRRLLGR